MSWKTLSSLDQLQQVFSVNQTSETPVAIFKHSTRCSISSTVKSRLERSWDFTDDFPIFYLDLIRHRDVSNEIESLLSVQHESPQLIILKKGEVVYQNSHLSISAEAAQSAV